MESIRKVVLGYETRAWKLYKTYTIYKVSVTHRVIVSLLNVGIMIAIHCGRGLSPLVKADAPKFMA